MNRKNQMIAWVAGVITIVVALMIIIVVIEPSGDGITRAQACKAMALVLTSGGDLKKREQKRESSYFSSREKNNWFVPYMDYLYEEGYLDPELTEPSLSSAQGLLTYEEAALMADGVSGKLKLQAGSTRFNKDSVIPEKEWWELYEAIRKETDAEGVVREIDAVLYGTPSNLPKAQSWTAYTTEGNFGFQGLALDSYIDCRIRFLEREGEIIAVRELISRDVVYENVWLAEAEGDVFRVYLGTSCREFPASSGLKEDPSLAGNLADLHLEHGVLKKVTIKKDRIKGKVLSVSGDAVEIEGYGEIPVSENFQVYKVYGEFQVLGISDILVGYDLQEFVAADGKLCAALLVREFDAGTIRVLLMDTGFRSLFHPSAEILLNCPADLEYLDSRGETKSERLEAGTRLTVTPEDERLRRGRMTVIPEGEEGFTLCSVERGQGQPVYSGSLEIKAEENGLVLVNDLYLEDYLAKVVPSEMPPSYETEALKAQAVCARTYAYRQIRGNSYSQYGAHVDDSTNFQVYNNVSSHERTDRAVRETYGEMLFYEDEPIEAFYYSTSCGRGADGSVWGGQGGALPYLQAKEIKSGGRVLSENDNGDFDEFIRSSSPSAYDSSFAMYRWETDIPASLLSGRINGVGEADAITVTSRGAGGIAEELEVTGSQGKAVIKGQSAIRSSLGDPSLKIRKKDGSVLEGSASLPSAFVSLEKRKDTDGNTVFHVYGGGFGHGVGMSQNGAQGMAKEGKTYKEILEFFYCGAEICR